MYDQCILFSKYHQSELLRETRFFNLAFILQNWAILTICLTNVDLEKQGKST